MFCIVMFREDMLPTPSKPSASAEVGEDVEEDIEEDYGAER